jgi:hypothetical protein
VSRRDGERCTFVGEGGRRCSERGFLEFHHVMPFAVGGLSTVANLALRCAAHNRYEAALYYGMRKNSAGLVREPQLVRESQHVPWVAPSVPQLAPGRVESARLKSCGAGSASRGAACEATADSRASRVTQADVTMRCERTPLLRLACSLARKTALESLPMVAPHTLLSIQHPRADPSRSNLPLRLLKAPSPRRAARPEPAERSSERQIRPANAVRAEAQQRHGVRAQARVNRRGRASWFSGR